MQGCRLFKRCPNLPAGYCVAGVQAVLAVWNKRTGRCIAGVQAVKAMSNPTCQAMCCRGAGCLSGVRTYLPGTVLQGCRLLKLCWNLPAGHCVAGMKARHCVAGVQAG